MREVSRVMDGDVEALVEAIENSFAVNFGDGELDDDSRVDDVCNALRSRLGERASACCFTSVAFCDCDERWLTCSTCRGIPSHH